MLQKNVNIQAFNTFGIPVSAAYFGEFDSVEKLNDLLKESQALNTEMMILGGGSNVLFTKSFDGVILRNCLSGIELVSESKNEVVVKAGAGVVWHDFVLYCINKGWGGIENLSLIPGSVGASPMQNIGAYGVEIKDVFHSLKAYHIETCEVRTFSKTDCAFGYRESVFKNIYKNQFVITEVSYRLKKNHTVNTTYGAINDALKEIGIDEPSIADVSKAVISIRESKLPNPKVLGNAGSFFKNPVIQKSHAEKLKKEFPTMPNYPVPGNENLIKVAAGWLIEEAGFKGLRKGNHGVHEKQALVLVNYGGATGNEIYALSTEIKDSVVQKFGIVLEREVNIL
jgi:UDP-N-acetylmuramate dehydrogenase